MPSMLLPRAVHSVQEGILDASIHVLIVFARNMNECSSIDANSVKSRWNGTGKELIEILTACIAQERRLGTWRDSGGARNIVALLRLNVGG